MADRDPVVFDIERGKVREFARAVHAHVAPDASLDDAAVIPPTFLTTMNFHESAEEIAAELGFELSRMLHGEQEYSFTGEPPIAGSQLRATSQIVERYEKDSRRGRLRFAVRQTEFVDAGGTLVATARMTAVETPADSDAPEAVDSQ